MGESIAFSVLRQLRRPLAALCVVLLAANALLMAAPGLAVTGVLCAPGIASPLSSDDTADGVCPFCTAACTVLPTPDGFAVPHRSVNQVAHQTRQTSSGRPYSVFPVGARAPPA